jgi:hypothetical protein
MAPGPALNLGPDPRGAAATPGGKAKNVSERRAFKGVELSIPAEPVLLHLVRMAAAAVAAQADLDPDALEDLRLAVDELCLPLMGPTGHTGRLLLRYDWDDESIEISCTLTAGDEGSLSDGVRHGIPSYLSPQIKGQAERLRDELSSQILDALVDEHGEMTIEGRAGVWLRMRRHRSREDEDIRT